MHLCGNCITAHYGYFNDCANGIAALSESKKKGKENVSEPLKTRQLTMRTEGLEQPSPEF